MYEENGDKNKVNTLTDSSKNMVDNIFLFLISIDTDKTVWPGNPLRLKTTAKYVEISESYYERFLVNNSYIG